MSRRSPSGTRARVTDRPLPRAFYERPVLVVARALLGRTLVRGRGRSRVTGTIVEVEAYRAADDPASHAFRGPTARNRVMFGVPGRAYVYFTYGMHHCLNVVCETRGTAAAVLIRAVDVRVGAALASRRRGRALPEAPPRARESAERALLSGPGRVAQALGLTRAHDGADLTRRGALWISDAASRRGPRRIANGPRIGIRLAADRPWRFWLEGHPSVSRNRAAATAEPHARRRVRR